MHCWAPTEPGRSWIRVLDSRRDVVARHHAGATNARRLYGEGEYQANEGIALQSIRRRLGAT